MSLLPFLPVFILIFVGSVHTKIDYRGADSLMQIQRVLELSSEIAKAQDVSVSDISTAESKYTTKRQSYALPNELLQLVKNHLLDLKKIQANQVQGQSNYVTVAPDHQSSSNQISDQGHYQAVQYQDEQLQHAQQYAVSDLGNQQYAVPEQQVQQYAFPEQQHQQYADQEQQHQQYAVPEQHQQYAVPEQQHQQYAVPEQQHQQYAVPEQQHQQYAVSQGQEQQSAVSHQQQYSSREPQQLFQVLKHPDGQYNSHSYVTSYSSPPTAAGHPTPQVLTAQEHSYSQQPLQYQTDPNHHYAIAAQQAIVAEVAQVPQQTHSQHKPQQQMFFVGGHPQSGSYTEALIPSTPQQFVSHQAAEPMTQSKAPVQINIHPQSYGLVSGYRGHISPQRDSYMPLQILINHLAEPMKYSQPGISSPGGPDQPKMPVYHYSPVPSGTLKNEAVPEMRIKSTYTPPNPHSDKYKDYPSSPPSPSSLNSLVPAAPAASPPSSSSWYSSSSSISSSPQSSQQSPPAVTSSNANSAQPIDWEDDEFIKYDFGYRVSDEEHKVEFGKTESKKDGVTKGSYHVLLPDGRLQVVKYWSDHTGYHTNISYSVPGVENKA